LILEVDQGLSDFYFSTIPKSIGLKKQFYSAHVSVVRNVIVPKKSFGKSMKARQLVLHMKIMFIMMNCIIGCMYLVLS